MKRETKYIYKRIGYLREIARTMRKISKFVREVENLSYGIDDTCDDILASLRVINHGGKIPEYDVKGGLTWKKK